MTTPRQLDLIEIEPVEVPSLDFVSRMRAVAKELSRVRGSVHSDDLRRLAAARGWVPAHPNAWGAIFAEPGWQSIDQRASTLPSNHGRMVRVWQWRG